jgi:tetratricopeptide (TPR) repeat protein
MLAASGILGLAFVWRVLRSASSAGFGMSDVRWWDYLFTQWRVVWLYVQLFFLPVGQSIDHDIALSRGLDRGAVIGLAAIIAALVIAWRWRTRFPLACYGFVVFLILLAPTSSFVPIRDLSAERRAYLPMIGLLLIAVDLLRAFIRDRKSLAAAAVVLCALGALACYERNQVWSSEIRLWTDAAEKAPEKARPRTQLAYSLLRSHRCIDALREFSSASRLQKPDYAMLVDWAAAYDCARDPNAALAKYEAAAQLEPRAHAYSQMGRIYLNAGRINEALAALNHAAAVEPNYPVTYLYRGMALSTVGQYSAAVEDYRRVLALDPANADAARGLNEAQARMGAGGGAKP